MKLKLLAPKIRSRTPSVRRNNEKKGKFLPILIGVGVAFFLCALLLYIFQDKLPHFKLQSKELVMPHAPNNDGVDFKRHFYNEGIVYESLSYATESPTLIMKLPEGTYVYFNSTEDPTAAIKVLKSVLARVSIENKGKKLKYVDLRFEKAVVKF